MNLSGSLDYASLLTYSTGSLLHAPFGSDRSCRIQGKGPLWPPLPCIDARSLDIRGVPVRLDERVDCDTGFPRISHALWFWFHAWF
jgi:hypothetical protein